MQGHRIASFQTSMRIINNNLISLYIVSDLPTISVKTENLTKASSLKKFKHSKTDFVALASGDLIN